VVQAVVVGQADNSQQKEFWEVEDSSLKGLSTILEFRDSDFHSQSRMRGMSKSVKAIKIGELIDLTKSNNVSYLSVDTEGSELEIFKNFPFEKYSFGFVTVEHNYAPQMSNLDEIFTRSGYLKILHKYSANESWYINNNWESIRGDEMQPNEKLRIEKLVSLNHDLS
jgi:hypothetical protein